MIGWKNVSKMTLFVLCGTSNVSCQSVYPTLSSLINIIAVIAYYIMFTY